MRILEEKYCKCSTCGTKLAYTEDDLHNGEYIICPCCQTRIFFNRSNVTCSKCGNTKDFAPYIGANGALYAKCSHCGNEEWLDDGIELDETNISYPQHFYHYTDAAKISDKETTEWVRDCITHLDKDNDCYMHQSGDTLCIAMKTDESINEATVYVCKKYSECSLIIPENKF